MIRSICKHRVAILISISGTFFGGVLLLYFPEMLNVLAALMSEIIDFVKTFAIEMGGFLKGEVHLPIWIFSLIIILLGMTLKKPFYGALSFLWKKFSPDEEDQTSIAQSSKSNESITAEMSAAFFSSRFGQAFPGLRGIQWFFKHEAVKRLEKLFEETIVKKNEGITYSPIWFWRDGNFSINDFRVLDSSLILLDIMELKINRIAAVFSHSYYKCFVYVEADPLEPTGLYEWDEDRKKECLRVQGYMDEEYGLYKNKHYVKRAEYDDNAAVVKGQLVNLGNEAELRRRFLSPYNFLIAAHFSSINNSRFDLELEKILNQMLKGNASIEELVERIEKLPKYCY